MRKKQKKFIRTTLNFIYFYYYGYESARPKYDRVVAFFEHTKRRKKSFYPVSPVRTHKVTHTKKRIITTTPFAPQTIQ